MQADEFWCRAFLAAMQGAYTEHADGGRWGNHRTPAVYCEAAADAALEVARRRGMATGERTSSALAPKPERVEFTAQRSAADTWNIYIKPIGGCVQVKSDCSSFAFNGDVYRIQWAETMPPTPAKVWIERPAKGGA